MVKDLYLMTTVENYSNEKVMLNASNILKEIRKNIKNKFNKRNPISLESKSDLQIAIK